MADMMRTMCLSIALLLVVGCATTREPPSRVATAVDAERDEPRLHLELIEKMLDGRRPYAALAHLDALEPEIAGRPEARLLRAETLRRLDRLDEAREIYEKLLDTELAALAHRGLGLLEASHGNLAGAVSELRRASALHPTSARIRNDLGYALIQTGSLEEARSELVTALQLGGSGRSARNLVLLYLVAGDTGSAERFAREHEIRPEAVSRLRSRAQSLGAPAPPAEADPEEGNGT
jgi:Flp pilus assembly protein TadD